MEWKATTPEQRQKLMAAGFVRVDELKILRHGKISLPKNIYTLESKPEWFGRWGTKNGTTVIYTDGGEIWLSIRDNTVPQEMIKLAELFRELCPQGREPVFIPGATGEQFSWREIIQRVANPDW